MSEGIEEAPSLGPHVVFSDGSGPHEVRTHVLIVAVGHYPAFLNGGPGSDPDAPLDQLQSPPASAKALAAWFIDEYRYDPAPLGSVALLVSEAGGSTFTRSDGAVFELEAPTYDVFEAAAQTWAALGADPASRVVFVFCGHGYGYAGESSLLMADFDFRLRNRWDRALDLGEFVAGMAETPASQQVYFIDACRKTHPSHLAPRTPHGRTPVQASDGVPREGLPRRNAPIIYSTGDDEPARGRTAGLSVFTHAFLDAMRGMGARDDTGDWRVNNLSMLEAMSHVSSRLTDAHFPEPQQPQGGEARLFTFHHLTTDPVSPVYVTRADEEACGPGELHYHVAGVLQTRSCTDEDMEVEVPLTFGQYDFELRSDTGEVLARASQRSAPTFRLAKLTP